MRSPMDIPKSINPLETQMSQIKQKRRKFGRKKISKSHDSESSVPSEFKMSGVTKLTLSPLTQKIVGCIVGEHVTAESSWKYLKKEVIEDNIELHADSSEFLPIKDDLVQYPETEILIGFIPEESNIHDTFHVVHTLEAKEYVLKIIERQKAELEERLKNSVRKPIGKWYSLGSEIEINGNQVQNFRPLFEIELKSKFPLINTKVSFNIRKVEDTIDGYVEFVDNGFPFVNIERKRIDASIQAVAPTVPNQAQTNPTYPTNVWTQYECAVKLEHIENKSKITNKENETFDRNVISFMSGKIQSLDETIRVNQNINMYVNDYADLVLKPRKKIDNTGNVIVFKLFSDVKHCGGYIVTDASWNAFTSGIVAISYAKSSLSLLAHYESRLDEVADAANGCAPALVWSYDDGLLPKLYLEAPRQVTYISWCPYMENIIIGGLESGQIVLWDLQNSLEEVEKLDVLTSMQKLHRLNIRSMVSWMKHTYDRSVIKPTVISKLACSHKDAIMEISWLYPSYSVTSCGKIKTGQLNVNSNQFYTVSLDGTILFWDISLNTLKPNDIFVTKKFKRLTKIPSGLTMNTSEYKSLNPHFRIILKDNFDKPVPITTIIRKTNFLEYRNVRDSVLKPETRQRFELVVNDQTKPLTWFVGSTLGQLGKFSWEGYDFSVGQSINSEQVSMSELQRIHDGPITLCALHPFTDDLFLTIGGHYFAIWCEIDSNPLIWRKCPRSVRYLSGGWTVEHPAYCVLGRTDGIFELWDFISYTTTPTRLVNMGGQMILNIFGSLTPTHCRKGTFAASDSNGTFSVLRIPPILNIHFENELDTMWDIMNRSLSRRKHLKTWMSTFKDKYKHSADLTLIRDCVQHELVSTKSLLEKRSSEIEKMNKIFVGVQWNSVQEKVMFDAMIIKKNLNLTNIDHHRKILQNNAADKKEKLLKQAQILLKKNKIFDSAKKNVFQQKRMTLTRKYSLDHEIDESIVAYLADYHEIEQRSLQYINKNQFQLQFDWGSVLEKSKQRRRTIEERLNFINVHKRYNSRKNLLAQESEHDNETAIIEITNDEA